VAEEILERLTQVFHRREIRFADNSQTILGMHEVIALRHQHGADGGGIE
jgi:hypothetical protein